MKWLFFLLILFPVLARSQGIKKDTVLLNTFNKGDTVIYDVGHHKLYFELPLVLKYLKKCRGSNFYKKQDIGLLANALKAHVRGSFYLQDTLIEDPQTGLIDTAAIQNKYLSAMQQVVPAMLSDGYVMVRDAHDRHLIPYLLINKRENGNYIGAYTEFTAFLPDGKRLYKAMVFHK
jgi:hypothetical protein